MGQEVLGISDKNKKQVAIVTQPANKCEKTDILAPGHFPLHPIANDTTTPHVVSPRALPFSPPTSLQGSHGAVGLMQR